MRIRQAINLLKFHDSWRDTNFLDEDFCSILLARWNQGDDRNPEHYRYAAFRRILESRKELTEDEFLSYINLCRSELSSVLYASPIIDLVKWEGLTSSQFEIIENMLDEWPSPVRKAFEKKARNGERPL